MILFISDPEEIYYRVLLIPFFFFLALSVYIASYIQIAFFVLFLSPLLAFLETKVLLMSILHQLGFRLLSKVLFC